MQSDVERRIFAERRSEDRRVMDHPDYKGPERRKGDRRAREDRRSTA
ncbi:hypothetical protein [Sphingopyxis sp. R3-92]